MEYCPRALVLLNKLKIAFGMWKVRGKKVGKTWGNLKKLKILGSSIVLCVSAFNTCLLLNEIRCNYGICDIW